MTTIKKRKQNIPKDKDYHKKKTHSLTPKVMSNI